MTSSSPRKLPTTPPSTRAWTAHNRLATIACGTALLLAIGFGAYRLRAGEDFAGLGKSTPRITPASTSDPFDFTDDAGSSPADAKPVHTPRITPCCLADEPRTEPVASDTDTEPLSRLRVRSAAVRWYHGEEPAFDAAAERDGDRRAAKIHTPRITPIRSAAASTINASARTVIPAESPALAETDDPHWADMTQPAGVVLVSRYQTAAQGGIPGSRRLGTGTAPVTHDIDFRAAAFPVRTGTEARRPSQPVYSRPLARKGTETTSPAIHNASPRRIPSESDGSASVAPTAYRERSATVTDPALSTVSYTSGSDRTADIDRTLTVVRSTPPGMPTAGSRPVTPTEPNSSQILDESNPDYYRVAGLTPRGALPAAPARCAPQTEGLALATSMAPGSHSERHTPPIPTAHTRAPGRPFPPMTDEVEEPRYRTTASRRPAIPESTPDTTVGSDIGSEATPETLANRIDSSGGLVTSAEWKRLPRVPPVDADGSAGVADPRSDTTGTRTPTGRGPLVIPYPKEAPVDSETSYDETPGEMPNPSRPATRTPAPGFEPADEFELPSSRSETPSPSAGEPAVGLSTGRSGRPVLTSAAQPPEPIVVPPVTDPNESSNMPMEVVPVLPLEKPPELRPIGKILPYSTYAPRGDRSSATAEEQQLALEANNAGFHRTFPPFLKGWCASDLYSYPLYFEDKCLERYGHTRPFYIQPFVSAAKAGVQFLGLPYQLSLDPMWKRRYSLGQLRPGECIPYHYYQVPLNAEAALVEASVLTGSYFLFAP